MGRLPSARLDRVGADRAEPPRLGYLPYADRRALLEELDLDRPAWRTPEAFDDGEALLEATRIQGLEGIVAKRRSEPYRPGERGWIKTKHRNYWRFGQELESAQRSRRARLTI